jgi:hypothetical protein
VTNRTHLVDLEPLGVTLSDKHAQRDLDAVCVVVVGSHISLLLLLLLLITVLLNASR